MTVGLRSHVQEQRAESSRFDSRSHPIQEQRAESSRFDSRSHPILAHMNQSGGKKLRGKKHQNKRSKKAGSSCMKKRGLKGGMGALGAVIKDALVPFGLFAWQKNTQRRKSNRKKSKMTRRR
jgi:hypothetical protein